MSSALSEQHTAAASSEQAQVEAVEAEEEATTTVEAEQSQAAGHEQQQQQPTFLTETQHGQAEQLEEEERDDEASTNDASHDQLYGDGASEEQKQEADRHEDAEQKGGACQSLILHPSRSESGSQQSSPSKRSKAVTKPHPPSSARTHLVPYTRLFGAGRPALASFRTARLASIESRYESAMMERDLDATYAQWQEQLAAKEAEREGAIRAMMREKQLQYRRLHAAQKRMETERAVSDISSGIREESERRAAQAAARREHERQLTAEALRIKRQLHAHQLVSAHEQLQRKWKETERENRERLQKEREEKKEWREKMKQARKKKGREEEEKKNLNKQQHEKSRQKAADEPKGADTAGVQSRHLPPISRPRSASAAADPASPPRSASNPAPYRSLAPLSRSSRLAGQPTGAAPSSSISMLRSPSYKYQQVPSKNTSEGSRRGSGHVMESSGAVSVAERPTSAPAPTSASAASHSAFMFWPSALECMIGVEEAVSNAPFAADATPQPPPSVLPTQPSATATQKISAEQSLLQQLTVQFHALFQQPASQQQQPPSAPHRT